MIVKPHRIKIRSFRTSIPHRCEGDKKKAKEVMDRIKAEFRANGLEYWKHNGKRFSELIFSEKMPRNASQVEIEKEWKRQERIMEEVRKSLEAKGYKVILESFRHKSQNIDGSWNVHTHHLFGLIKDGQFVEMKMKELRQLQLEILKKYDEEMYKRYTKKNSEDIRSGERNIPVWFVQRVKAKVRESRKGLLGLQTQFYIQKYGQENFLKACVSKVIGELLAFAIHHKGTLRLDYELKHSHSEESDLPNAPAPHPQPPALTKYRKRKKKKSLTSII